MIFQIYIWVLSFISVYVASLWILVNYVSKFFKSEEVNLLKYPLVTIAIPCYNEEKTINPTLKSILNQTYPKDKLEIIIVDDLSKDSSIKVIEKFIKNLNGIKIKLIKHPKNFGKAAAVNTALKIAKGDLFWVYDADSFADKELLINMVKKFYEKDNENVAAVVAITLIRNQGNWVEKMQRLEYVMAAFSRKLLGSVDTLHTTNALSLFKTKILKKIGGFDVGNLTEDLEIAMRLRYNGYRVIMCEKSNFHTSVPNTVKKMWMQRVRWFRGFIHNNLKYKKMILNKNYGLLGMFQIPLQIFFLLAVFVSITLFGYTEFKLIWRILIKIYLLKNEIFNLYFINLLEILLQLDWRVIFPSMITLAFGLYLYFEAHRYVKEKWKFYIPSLLYLFVYPLFRSMQWIHALILEIIGAERKW